MEPTTHAPGQAGASRDAVHLLTQPFAAEGLLTFQQQALLYQLAFDYFFEGRPVTVWPHPEDMLYYSLLFPRARVMGEGSFAGMIAGEGEGVPGTVAAITEEGISDTFARAESSFVLGRPFVRAFPFIHRYGAAARLLDVLPVESVAYIGDSAEMFGRLLARRGRSLSAAGTLTVVDDWLAAAGDAEGDGLLMMEDRLAPLTRTLRELPEDAAYLFLNTGGDYCFYDPACKELWRYIVPLCLTKRVVRGTDVYSDDGTEVAYLYTKNEEWRAMANEQRYVKPLEHTGIEVEKVPLEDKDQQLKVLEGLLDATETRLLFYMDMVRRMKEKDAGKDGESGA